MDSILRALDGEAACITAAFRASSCSVARAVECGWRAEVWGPRAWRSEDGRELQRRTRVGAWMVLPGPKKVVDAALLTTFWPAEGFLYDFVRLRVRCPCGAIEKCAALNMRLKAVGDEAMEVLLQSPSVGTCRVVEVEATDVTDVGLCRAAALPFRPALTALMLDSLVVTDEGLSVLAELGMLNTLRLQRAPRVTCEGLRHLPSMRSLHTLEVSSARVKDAGMLHVAKVPRLKSLTLHGLEVTDVGLRHLGTMKTLTDVRFGTLHHISDVGVGEIVRIPSLRNFATCVPLNCTTEAFRGAIAGLRVRGTLALAFCEAKRRAR